MAYAWRWWTQALVSCLPSRWQHLLQRQQRRVLLQQQANTVHIALQQDDSVQPLLQLQGLDADDIAALLPDLLQPAARQWPRWWWLPAQFGLRRQLELPQSALARLRDVVRFEIERQTPFNSDDVVFDVRYLGASARAGLIVAELVVVPKQALPFALTDASLPWSGVDLVDADGKGLGLNVLPPPQRFAPVDVQRRWQWLLGGFAVLMTVAMFWQMLDNRRAAADALEAEVALLAERARNNAVQAAQLHALVDGQAFLQRNYAERANAVDVIEALSKQFSDDTSLERLAIEGARLSLTGYSSQASALVGQLEGGTLWRAPSLSGALQTDARTRRDRFTVIAELSPKPPRTAAAVTEENLHAQPAAQGQEHSDAP